MGLRNAVTVFCLGIVPVSCTCCSSGPVITVSNKKNENGGDAGKKEMQKQCSHLLWFTLYPAQSSDA